MIPYEDIESLIQEWFSKCMDFQDIAKLYSRMKSEMDKQVDYMSRSIAKRMVEEGLLNE